jgi:hypothetical protein
MRADLWSPSLSAPTLWANFSGKLHADMRRLRFAPHQRKLYCTTDGGIYVWSSETSNWLPLANMAVAESHSSDYDSYLGLALAGLQDNGSGKEGGSGCCLIQLG